MNTNNPNNSDGRERSLSESSCSALIFSGPEFEYESWNARDCDVNSILIPWLFLPWLSPKLASLPDQSRWAALPLVRRQVYDILLESRFGQTLKNLEAKLRDIYPRSFLFRLAPEQTEYRNVPPRFLTIRDFVELSHQILSSHFECPIEGETGLAELVRTSYSQIPEQIRHNNRLQIDDELEELRLAGVELEDSFFLLPNDQGQP